MVEVNIIGIQAEAVEYPDGADTKDVKEDLKSAYGMGILKVRGSRSGVIDKNLKSGSFDYHVTEKQGTGLDLYTLLNFCLPVN